MLSKLKKKIEADNEKGSRQGVLEELFNDFNRNRYSVYKFNFIRGVFFGFGSVLGGTLLVALVVWSLNAIGFLVPALADFINQIVDVMNGVAR